MVLAAGLAGSAASGSDASAAGASEAALSQMGSWVGMLDSQAGRLVQMGQNMVTVCRDAWQTALAVVQCVKAAVQTVSAALATSLGYWPAWVQWHARESR